MDNGKGFDEAVIENIFEAFVSKRPEFKRAQSIGPGLSAIVERNGSTIRAENKSVGVCFNFDLPIVGWRLSAAIRSLKTATTINNHPANKTPQKSHQSLRGVLVEPSGIEPLTSTMPL